VLLIEEEEEEEEEEFIDIKEEREVQAR